MKKLTKKGKKLENDFISFIKGKEEIVEKFGAGELAQSYICDIETLTGYWLYAYGIAGLNVLPIFENETDSMYICDINDINITFNELKKFLKECII